MRCKENHSISDTETSLTCRVVGWGWRAGVTYFCKNCVHRLAYFSKEFLQSQAKETESSGCPPVQGRGAGLG